MKENFLKNMLEKLKSFGKDDKNRLDAAGITNMGKVRKNNEDNLYFDGKYMEEDHGSMEEAFTFRGDPGQILCYAVFDGIGGAAGGEVASYLAAKTFDEKVKELLREECSPKQFLKEACLQMNRKICEGAKERMISGMGTTAAILYFYQNEVYICNLGDSPIFRFRDGKLKKIHEEHTNRAFLESQGLTHKKPAITQFLGIPETETRIQPYIAKGEIRKGDQYLISSDGLTDMVPFEEIEQILKESEKAEAGVNRLLERALEQGARDNTTIILCKWN